MQNHVKSCEIREIYNPQASSPSYSCAATSSAAPDPTATSPGHVFEGAKHLWPAAVPMWRPTSRAMEDDAGKRSQDLVMYLLLGYIAYYRHDIYI